MCIASQQFYPALISGGSNTQHLRHVMDVWLAGMYWLVLAECKPCCLLQTLVLSTNSWVGGRNNALGIIYLVIGGLGFLTAVIFFCSYHLNKKRKAFADPAYLSWNQTDLIH